MELSLWLIFITGLSAGGISCMAIQGGLVTSSLASQLENDFAGSKNPRVKRGKKGGFQVAYPITFFLLSKLFFYTLLGGLLGALGSIFSFTPGMRGILQLLIAIFMLGNGFRMLNLHPFFRYFNIEPPARVRRWIRRKSKDKDSWFSPVVMGAITVLIPCGITQSMMALAVSSASPWYGAAILFAFTLGASPVFFLLTYLATRLGSLTEKYFSKIVAIALILFALVSFDAGLNLLGFPYTATRYISMQRGGTNPAEGTNLAFDLAQPANVLKLQDDVIVNVKTEGYYPYESLAPAGKPVNLHLVTKDTFSCARAFTIPSLGVQVLLEATGEKVIQLPPQKAGTELAYTCSMGMYSGMIRFQ